MPRLAFSAAVNKRIELGATFANEPVMTGAGKDRFIVNWILLEFGEEGNITRYLQKRPGCTSTTINSGVRATGIYSWEGNSQAVVTIWTTNEVYVGANKVGTTSSSVSHVSEGFLGTTPVIYVLDEGDNTGWYYPSDAGVDGATFTGTTTNASPTVTGIASTAGIYSGQLVSAAAGITAGTRVLTVDSSTQITLNANATASGARTITRSGLAKILDADYPGNASKTVVSKFIYKDGYTFVLTKDGRIYNSDLNSITAWSASNYIAANEFPDYGTELAYYKNYIVAFNNFSIEFFENAGNASGSPLSRIPSLATRIGAPGTGQSGTHFVTEGLGTVFWLGSDKQGGNSLYAFNGYAPENISCPELDVFLSKDSIRSLSVITVYGRTLAVMESSTSNNAYNLVYDIKARRLYWWTFGNSILIRTAVCSGEGVKSIHFIDRASNTTGKYYTMSPLGAVWQDDGSNYTATLQTGLFDGGTSKYKFLKCLRLIGDKQSSTCTIGVSWSDDDYNTFSTVRNVDMSQDNTRLWGCGRFRRRAFKLTNTSNTPARLESIDLEEMDVGTT
jgi:hypothetical protein